MEHPTNWIPWIVAVVILRCIGMTYSRYVRARKRREWVMLILKVMDKNKFADADDLFYQLENKECLTISQHDYHTLIDDLVQAGMVEKSGYEPHFYSPYVCRKFFMVKLTSKGAKFLEHYDSPAGHETYKSIIFTR